MHASVEPCLGPVPSTTLDCGDGADPGGSPSWKQVGQQAGPELGPEGHSRVPGSRPE